MIYRLIAPKWLNKKPLEGEFSDDQIRAYNSEGYNVYYFPNYPTIYGKGRPIDGTDIDNFSWCFIDCDLKDRVYDNKEVFLEKLMSVAPPPTSIVDSGHGVHSFWKISNLDGMSFLRFQRRLSKLLNTDTAVANLCQLMRVPGTLNTKVKDNYVECVELYADNIQYTAEEFDKLLPPITLEDEAKCVEHYNRTHGIDQDNTTIDETLPPKFGKLLRENPEAKECWSGSTEDRSKSDYRLGHLMFAQGFTKAEALSVLVNSAKALQRAPSHRRNYATNIVNKIWTFELTKDRSSLSNSVADLLQQPPEVLAGTRIPCWKYIDNTECGFRIGHVMGLVAGSGVGKTAMALNIFLGFVQSNPQLTHFFVPLEQTDKEIALRWKTMCGDNTAMHSKVQVMSNYDEKGRFRDLSLNDIKEHILKYQETTQTKVGCVVIDHIGILCNNNRLGQDEGVKQIAKAMKGFAEETQTFLIMQSQTSRMKAGIGDIELDKDAAFGTSVFENFCDYLVTLWQPLKRVYKEGAPTVMAFKFCKIRHKNQKLDTILEDVPYMLYFDPDTQRLRQMTQDQETSFKFYVSKATNMRKQDKRTEVLEYTSVLFKEANDT